MRLPPLSHPTPRRHGRHRIRSRSQQQKGLRLILPEPLARLWDALLGPPPSAQAATFEDARDQAPPVGSAQSDTAPAEEEGTQAGPSHNYQMPAEERKQAAALIADALLKAEELVMRSSRGADPRLVQDTVAALRSLGEYLERSVTALTAEREQLETQVQTVRALVEDLTTLARELREAGPRPVPSGGPSLAEQVTEERPSSLFIPERPLTLRVDGVTDFRLLVRLERALTGHEAVQSAGIESYQGEEARFVLALRSPLTVEGLQAALATELGREIRVKAAAPGEGEIDLQLGPEPVPGLS